MPKPNFFEYGIKRIYEIYSQDVGNSLIHLGAVGWLFSAAAQITMIAKNNDIDKKEKKFLIPQEIADGVINVGLYYTVCTAIKKWGDKLLENCDIITPATERFMNKFNQFPNTTKNFVERMSSEYISDGFIKPEDKKGRLTNFFNGTLQILDPFSPRRKDVKRNDILRRVFSKFKDSKLTESTMIELQAAQKEFNSFKNGFGVVMAVGASVLACNLLTPIARNITANYYQKKLIERTGKKGKKLNKPQEVVPLQYQVPKSQVFNTFKI